MTRYEILDGKFLWRFEGDEDKVGTMLAFVFNPDDAADLAGLLNTSMHLAAIVLDDNSPPSQRPVHVTSEDIRKLAAVPPSMPIFHPVVIEGGLTYLDEPRGN